MREALSLLGLRAAGGNYGALREACARYGITPQRGKTWTFPPSPVRLEDVLVVDGTYNTGLLKRRLLAAGFLTESCAECGIGPEWCGKRLTLEMDHINGVHTDNRLENLRMLCPNCHSQTWTYGNKTRNPTPTPTCLDCPATVTRVGRRCRACANRRAGRERWKVQWPPPAELRKRVTETSYSAVARELGVSDVAVHGFLRRHEKTLLLASLGSNQDSSASEADVLPVTPLANGRVGQIRTVDRVLPKHVPHHSASTR